ncbi:hypothetical protein AVEN_50658-1 [Araneus ventricosus]|uniref:Uncharacterized protein n=1 Tax=Araneus ventricosus TaxID=182803 RepID=A0A4Y2JLL8_ARAVE|nr:hypothetical protein AVEN_50658-1 [Araneus ventricosus]
MDIVFFCYAANDPESFQNLEKWIGLMATEVKKEEMHFSPPRTKNDMHSFPPRPKQEVPSPPPRPKQEVYSFLVADLRNLGSQLDVASRLAQKVKKVKESFGIKRFIEISFEDEESASSAFQTIFNEVIPPILGEKSFNLYEESPEKCCELLKPYSDNPSSLGFPNYSDRNLEENLEPEYLLFKRAVKMALDIICDKTISFDEMTNKIKNLKSSLRERS